MEPVRSALRHVRDRNEDVEVDVADVRDRADGSRLVVVQVRGREVEARWRFGVLVDRGGEVLDDGVKLDDRRRRARARRRREAGPRRLL